MLFVIAQTKRFGTLNATQKIAALRTAQFLKNCLKIVKNAIFGKNGQIMAVFLDFFNNGVL